MRFPLIKRSFFLAALLIAFLCSGAFADEPANAPYPAVMELHLNHVKKGTLFALISEGDVWVLISDFEQLGIRGFGGKRETFDGKKYVSLKSLSPEVTYNLDEDNGILSMIVQPIYLGQTTVMNFSGAKHPKAAYQKTISFFLITP